MHFVLLIIIVELFLYWYHINDIHKYRFEDFDIRDHILMNDKMYKVKNIRDMINDYNHIDLFDQKQEDLICHIMVYLNLVSLVQMIVEFSDVLVVH